MSTHTLSAIVPTALFTLVSLFLLSGCSQTTDLDPAVVSVDAVPSDI